MTEGIGVVAGVPNQLKSIGIHSDFAEQLSGRSDSDVRPAVALGQMTLSVFTCDNTEAVRAGFQGVHHVLTVDLAAAWKLRHLDMLPIPIPLFGKSCRTGYAVGTDINLYI